MSCRHPVKNQCSACLFVHYFILVADQLHEVMSHIQDLVEINGRVEKADLPVAYHEPQVSATNDI